MSRDVTSYKCGSDLEGIQSHAEEQGYETDITTVENLSVVEVKEPSKLFEWGDRFSIVYHEDQEDVLVKNNEGKHEADWREINEFMSGL